MLVCPTKGKITSSTCRIIYKYVGMCTNRHLYFEVASSLNKIFTFRVYMKLTITDNQNNLKCQNK